jgi:hypothetical protein
MIAVVDVDANRPVWWLASDAFTTMLPYSAVGTDSEPMATTDEKAVERELLARGVEPAALDASRKANRPLHSFEYGSVPTGFRQALPAGAAPPLARGTRYSVAATGGLGLLVGQVVFRA